MRHPVCTPLDAVAHTKQRGGNMYNLKRSNTIIAGLPGLLVVALLVVACRDSVSPGHRAPAGPEGWLVEPPPLPPPQPPPMPPPPPPHLEFTQQPNDAVVAAACVPLPEGVSTITAVVTVKDEAGGKVDFNGDVTIRIGHDAALSPPGHLCEGMTATDHITVTLHWASTSESRLRRALRRSRTAAPTRSRRRLKTRRPA